MYKIPSQNKDLNHKTSFHASLYSPTIATNQVNPLIQLQKLQGNQFVLNTFKKDNAISQTKIIQRMKSTKPSDDELVKIGKQIDIFDIMEEVDEKAGNNVLGPKIWEKILHEYKKCEETGKKLMLKLNEAIEKYESNEKSNEKKDSQIKFDTYYSSYAALVNEDNHDHYFVNSQGRVPGSQNNEDVSQEKDEGHYSNEFNLSSGAIIATLNSKDIDEKAKNKQNHMVLDNSELLWHQYKYAAEQHYNENNDKDELIKEAQRRISKITRQTVINPFTQAVMYRLSDEPELPTNLILYPRNPGFAAILGTPNVKSSAYMLIDHMAELKKTIEYIKINKGSDIDIVFKDIK
ncbi:hypothetical protein [Paenibacillus campi]|uniref:hypothetical protein n=1 Tax=Paenibacillus campi TaxID=3106031 RepID=UPI002AFF8512|nr:hypothetical protein [Paenibacillus sp. SGZ-1009]